MAIQGVGHAEKGRVDDRSLCGKKIALMTAVQAKRGQRSLLRSTTCFVLMAVVVLVSGCSQPLSTREKSAIGGGLLGGAAGSIIGAAVGSPGAGAAIGTALGAGTGALYGDRTQNQEVQQAQQQQQIQQNELELQRQRQELERLRQQQRRYDDDY